MPSSSRTLMIKMNINHKDILKYRKNVTSQYGEDGVIEFLSHLLGDNLHKNCLEVGAGDGETFSNVFSLWKTKNWNAVLVESDKTRYERCLSLVMQYSNVFPVNKSIAQEGSNSIEQIADGCGVDLNNGLIVIDIYSNKLRLRILESESCH